MEIVFVAGLAYDYCVGATALDAAKNGWETVVLSDCTEGVLRNSSEGMKARLESNGVKHLNVDDILDRYATL